MTDICPLEHTYIIDLVSGLFQSISYNFASLSYTTVVDELRPWLLYTIMTLDRTSDQIQEVYDHVRNLARGFGYRHKRFPSMNTLIQSVRKSEREDIRNFVDMYGIFTNRDVSRVLSRHWDGEGDYEHQYSTIWARATTVERWWMGTHTVSNIRRHMTRTALLYNHEVGKSIYCMQSATPYRYQLETDQTNWLISFDKFGHIQSPLPNSMLDLAVVYRGHVALGLELKCGTPRPCGHHYETVFSNLFRHPGLGAFLSVTTFRGGHWSPILHVLVRDIDNILHRKKHFTLRYNCTITNGIIDSVHLRKVTTTALNGTSYFIWRVQDRSFDPVAILLRWRNFDSRTTLNDYTTSSKSLVRGYAGESIVRRAILDTVRSREIPLTSVTGSKEDLHIMCKGSVFTVSVRTLNQRGSTLYFPLVHKKNGQIVPISYHDACDVYAAVQHEPLRILFFKRQDISLQLGKVTTLSTTLSKCTPYIVTMEPVPTNTEAILRCFRKYD
jgi:hypothetical protein